MSSGVAFAPCLQRCIALHTACLHVSAAEANKTCAAWAAGGNVTKTNANCYCGDNNPESDKLLIPAPLPDPLRPSSTFSF